MKKLSAFCITLFCLFEAKSQSSETLNPNPVFSPSLLSNDPDGQSALQSRLRYIAQWQAGNIGRFTSTDQWIGIGQPLNPALLPTISFFPVYGSRIQWNGQAYNWALRDNGTTKDALLEWGNQGGLWKLRYITDPTT